MAIPTCDWSTPWQAKPVVRRHAAVPRTYVPSAAVLDWAAGGSRSWPERHPVLAVAALAAALLLAVSALSGGSGAPRSGASRHDAAPGCSTRDGCNL
jgi:hypothetical protein